MNKEIMDIVAAQSALSDFRQEIRKLLASEDIQAISDILSLDSYLSYSKKEIERTIFQIANMNYIVLSLSVANNKNKHIKTLKYLIFDYNISEEVSINQTSVSEEIKEMFKVRKFQEDLNQELEVKNKPSNKVKI
jgi:hypothetical protein